MVNLCSDDIAILYCGNDEGVLKGCCVTFYFVQEVGDLLRTISRFQCKVVTVCYESNINLRAICSEVAAFSTEAKVGLVFCGRHLCYKCGFAKVVRQRDNTHCRNVVHVEPVWLVAVLAFKRQFINSALAGIFCREQDLVAANFYFVWNEISLRS